MSEVVKPFIVACLVLTINVAGAQSQPSVIRGTLREKGSPIAEATLFLQSFDDEHCAKLFTSKKRDLKSRTKLDSCMHDVTSVSPDARGYYQFAVPKGWYAIHFLWNLSEKPKHPETVFKEGQWWIVYAGRKDSTGKYDTMAQDSPLYYSGYEDVVRDFDTDR